MTSYADMVKRVSIRAYTHTTEPAAELYFQFSLAFKKPSFSPT